MADKVYTSRRGAVFVQKTGANSQPLVLRCLDADEISSPRSGVELIKCWNAFGNGWLEMGKTLSAPDSSTVSITQLTEQTLSELEKIYCPITLLFAQTSSGKVTEINNAERVIIMTNAEITDEGYSDIVHHVDDNASTHSVSFAGDSDVSVVGYPTIVRLTTTETEALNDIHGNVAADCDDRLEPGDKLIAVADSAVAPALASVLYSTDTGATWTAAAADPFAAGASAVACQWFMKDSTTERWLVGMEAPAGAQGMVAYSDDDGATWTTVNIGGAAAGHGPMLGGSLFVYDSSSIWLASAAGYIYKSEDGGETWEAKESGSIGVEDYNHIHFYDADYGVAVGNADQIAVTEDGGDTWTAGTATGGAAALLCCWMTEENTIWAGDDAGDLWYSHDNAVTWTERTGISGTPAEIRDVEFFNSQVGCLVSDTAAPVGAVSQTFLGGYSWRAITTATNSGLNSLFVVNENLVFMVGEANGGTAFIGKLSA